MSGRAQEFELDPDLGNAADRPADGIRGAKPAPARSYAADMWRVRRGVDAPLVGAGTEAMSESKCFLRTGSL